MRIWMIGRYGTDELSRFLMWTGLVLMLLSWARPLRFLVIPAWIVLIYAYYRCFSRKIAGRSRERDIYIRITGRFKSFFSVNVRKIKERKTHIFYSCPGCHATVRVPRGKGRIAITCRKCGREFIKTT